MAKKIHKISKLTNNVVKKTMKDVYTLNRSSLLRAEKPVPKYGEGKKLQKAPMELEDVEEESSTLLIHKPEKKIKKIIKKLLGHLKKRK